MPIIPNSINFATYSAAEHEDSPTERMTDQGFEATRFWRVPWAQRIAFMQALMPLETPLDTDGGRMLLRLGHEYPHYDGAFVSGVGLRGKLGRIVADGADTRQASYELAIVEATYTTGQFTDGGGGGGGDTDVTLAEETLESAAQHVTLSEQTVYWDAAGTAEPLDSIEAPQFVLALLDYTYSRKRVRLIPTVYTSLLGKVNTSAIVSSRLGLTFAAETLLYLSVNTHRVITQDGVQAWDATLRFTFNPAGWNLFRKHGTAAPVAVYKAAGGGQFKPFETGDMSSLIRQS